MTKQGIDYEIWAESETHGQTVYPNIKRSAITVEEAKQQAEALVEHLLATTVITDWQAKWRRITYPI